MLSQETATRILILFIGALLGLSAHALTDYQRQQITQHLDSPKTSLDAALFDGQAFNPAISLDQATVYYNGFIDQMNRAVRGWNMLSQSDKQGTDAQELFGRLQEKLAWSKAMEAAYPAFRESKTGAAAATPQAPSGAGASGGLSDYQKQGVLQYLDGNNMRLDTSLFNGTEFSSSASFAEVQRYYEGYNADFEKAKRAWNSQLSSSGRATPDGQAIQARLLQADEWAKAMAARYPAFAAAAAQQQELDANKAAAAAATTRDQQAAQRVACEAFQQDAMTPLNRDPMSRLINQLMYGNSRIGSVDGVQNHARVASEVAGVCGTADLPLLTSTPCWYVLNRADFDPVRWCEAATQALALIQAAVLNHARSVVDITGSSTFQSPEELRERDGFLTFEGPVTFDDRLYFSSDSLEMVQGSLADLLQAAGIEDAEQALWAEQIQRVDVLRTEVERLASSWVTPENVADNYSTRIAADQVRRTQTNAEVLDAFLSRATWKIHRNELGVILRRTMPGYVLFKLPEDPYCQLRPYTLTEQHTGAGNYQEAAGVSFGYVRFQTCP